jgi:beta-carotene 3-hydroxylase
MDILLNVIIFAGLAIYMEYVAWFTHKYVMHGFLWILHEDHHRPRHRGLQKNDLFAVLFSAISFLAIFAGLVRGWMPLTSAGLGIALYGVGYVLFHDVMFHRRIPGLRIKARGAYLSRIVRAHRVHHQGKSRRDSTSFGFLCAPKRYANPRTAT